MAVEYEISSDVAVIKETGSVSQCARVTQMYSGQITYDDEAGSKFATATINGKSQRVMLCIAVNGTVNYDDVPSLYSTVDGHRCLNIVTPTETGTPDDVPSLYETVVIDGQNVRAVRCIMINKTPVYDGVSSTCTFTGDDGKTHTAQLVNKITGGSVQVIIKGTSPLNLPDAIANSLSYVKAFGGTEQRNLPDNYIQRDYIYMLDDSYLLTDIVPTYDCKIEMDFQTTSLPSGAAYFLGGRTGNYAGIFFAKTAQNAFLVDAFGTTSADRYTSSVAPASNTRYKFTFNNKVMALESGGSTLFTHTFTEENANGAELVINGLNTNGNLLGSPAGIYLYSFKVWNAQGQLIADYVPAVQKGTVPVVGFYDTVSKTFKTATAGTFAAGSETAPTPDTPMDIVSNNGVLKYGVIGKNLLNDTKFKQGYLSATAPEPVESDYVSSGTIRPTNWIVMPVKVIAGQSYTIKFFTEETFSSIGYAVYQNGAQAQRVGSVALPNNETTITPNASGNLYVWCAGVSGVPLTSLIGKAQIELGSTATDYEPYRTGVYADGTVETIQTRLPGITPENFTGTLATITKKIGLYSYDFSYSPASASSWNGILKSGISTIAGHKYYFCAEMSASAPSILGITFSNGWGASKSKATVEANTVYLIHNVAEATATLSNVIMYARCGSTGLGDYTGTAHNIGLFDLTEMFGAGNEPATADDARAALGFQTATAEMLLKVSDYQDVQSILDGVITRNVGVKVLDGTENWTVVSGSDNAYLQASELPGVKTNSSVICSHLINSSTGTPRIQLSGVLRVYGIGTEWADKANFQSWLADQYAAGTPVIVVYPLAEPTTESVAGQTLQVTDGDNVLEITQASLDGLELEAQYNAAVQLTIQEVEDASLDNNVEVTIS